MDEKIGDGLFMESEDTLEGTTVWYAVKNAEESKMEITEKMA